MKTLLRAALLGASAATSLVFSAAALGAYSPTLSVTREVDINGQDVSTAVRFSQPDSDQPTAKVQILSPAGFVVNLTQALGTQLGTVDGTVVAGALGGGVVPVTGTIVVGDPNLPAFQASAQECTGALFHDAIWMLNLTAAGQTLPNPLPVYVDRVTTGPFSTFATASLQLCLPHPSVAAFQIKLLDATLHLNRVFLQPAAPGRYRWTAISTPYRDDATPDAAATIEAQGVEITPVRPSYSARIVRKVRKVRRKAYTDYFYSYRARVIGSLRVGGDAAPTVNVEILANGKKVATGSTNGSGKLTKTIRLKARKTMVQLAFSREPTALLGAACDPRLPFPGTDVLMPCGAVTNGGFTVATEARQLVKPKLTHKRIWHKHKKKARR